MFVEASKAGGRKRLGRWTNGRRSSKEAAKQGGRETQMIKITLVTRRRATSTTSVVAKLVW